MDLSPGTQEAILALISVLVGLLGPKYLEKLLDFLKLEGQWRVVGVYVVSLILGVVGLVVSGQFFEIEFTPENLLAIAGLILAAATYAYHRLKDQGKI